MIEVRNVFKHFEGRTALDGLSLTVPDGSIYGLVGPNGAGKSTLIRHITGILRPDEGSILVDGEEVYENQAIKSEIAYISDDFFYFLPADVEEMMKFYKGLYQTFDEEVFNSLQQYFPNIDMKSNIRRLSKGMQKQVAFWLTISCNPRLLVLDEPVDGLDPVMRKQIWSLLVSRVAESGMTVLVSSHNLRELEDVCDTVGIINKGKMILEKSLMDLQGSVSKIQVAFDGEMPELSDSCKVLHESVMGRVHTLIIRGEREQVIREIEAMQPLIMDVLPLTLEEIFIYETEQDDYAVKEIIL